MSLKTWIQEKLLANDLNNNFAIAINPSSYNEDYTALTDGHTVTFSTAFHFAPGTLRVYLDGLKVRKNSGTTNFVEVLDGNGNGIQFTMSTAPAAAAELISEYVKATVDL